MSLEPSHHPLLEGCDLRVKLPLTWGQMDSFSHVNNIQYFKWFEDVRMAYFLEVGIFEHVKRHKVGPILARTQCRFIIPLAFPDTVHLGTRIEEVGVDRFTMVYSVVSEANNALAATGERAAGTRWKSCCATRRHCGSPTPRGRSSRRS